MPLRLSLERSALLAFVTSIVDANFPDGQPYTIGAAFDEALSRIETCFSRVVLPGYTRDGAPYFNHLHGDQSACFWYLLSHSAFLRGEQSLAEKCMLLNKARNGILIVYDTVLPPHFLLIHTVGTMLGKASYGDFFVATQNVTVGTHKGNAPAFGRGVILYPQSFVAGKTVLGDFCRVAVASTVIDLVVPEHHVVSGNYPDTVARPSKRPGISEYFSGFD